MERQDHLLDSTSPSVGHEAGPCTTCTSTPTRRNLLMQRWRRQDSKHVSNRDCIPASLGDIFPDPEGALEQIGVLSPRDFWRFYYTEDGPNDPAAKQMGRKWGELWLSYLVSDPLVVSGAVPLVLQKKAQLTHVNEDKSIYIAEMKALKLLRERLEAFDVASVGGLIMAMCGRIQIAIQQGDLDAASLHLQAIKQLWGMHILSGTEWLCSVWSDLRVVSSTGNLPILPRSIPNERRHLSAVSLSSTADIRHLALRNARAFKLCVGSQFRLLYDIFRRLHELEITAKNTSSPHNASMQHMYEVTYDCCVLHAISRQGMAPGSAADLLELVAICLKLCAWEKASYCVPRGGEIERTLLRRALKILQDRRNSSLITSPARNCVTSNAMFWMIFTLTATASTFAPADIELWITHLKEITSLSTPSTFKRALHGWPLAPWWLTRAVNEICVGMKPVKGSWQTLNTERNTSLIDQSGMRLKLLVIEH